MAKNTIPDRQFGVRGLGVTLAIRADITDVSTHAVVTPIDCDGNDADYTGRQIRRVAGMNFHKLLREQGLPETHGFTLVTQIDIKSRWAFGQCVFVVDESHEESSGAICAALAAVDAARFRSVAMPTLRLDICAANYPKSISEASRDIIAGIGQFAKRSSGRLEEIVLVVNNSDCATQKEIFLTLAYDLERAR
jgi:hypothetical protein